MQTEIMFNYQRQEMIGQPIEMLLPMRYRDHHPALRESFVSHPIVRPMGAGRDLFGRKRDGSEFSVEVALTPITSPENTVVILASVVDIQERKRAEEAS